MSILEIGIYVTVVFCAVILYRIHNILRNIDAEINACRAELMSIRICSDIVLKKIREKEPQTQNPYNAYQGYNPYPRNPFSSAKSY